ncbi:hypothetical protein ES705_32102 [subsurface metagenome]
MLHVPRGTYLFEYQLNKTYICFGKKNYIYHVQNKQPTRIIQF